MKKILLGCAILGLTMGCVTIKRDANGFVYKRWWGKQSIDGLRILTHPNGTTEISFDKQKSDSGNLDKFLSKATKLGAEAAKIIAAGGVGGAVVK